MTCQKHRGAFTLVELLVVMAIATVLAGMLVPVLAAVRGRAKVAFTGQTIDGIGVALVAYYHETGVYPPDDYRDSMTKIDRPSKALIFFLGGEAVGMHRNTYFQFRKNALANYGNVTMGTTDPNNEWTATQPVFEAVDAWDQPFLYNRAAFANGKNDRNNAPDGAPWHNKTGFDLYSVGPNGTTGNTPPSARPAPSSLLWDSTFISDATDGDPTAGGYCVDDIGNI